MINFHLEVTVQIYPFLPWWVYSSIVIYDYIPFGVALLSLTIMMMTLVLYRINLERTPYFVEIDV